VQEPDPTEEDSEEFAEELVTSSEVAEPVQAEVAAPSSSTVDHPDGHGSLGEIASSEVAEPVETEVAAPPPVIGDHSEAHTPGPAEGDHQDAPGRDEDSHT
jgi:hypothetical protein